MESAAYFALPMPVRQAASVCAHAKNAADTDMSRTRETSVSASPADMEPYKMRTARGAKKYSPAAQGAEIMSVIASAYMARSRPSCSFPFANASDTAGTTAAASP